MTSIWSLSSALGHILAIFPDVTYLLSVLLVVILQICLKVSFAPARRPDLSNIPGPWYTRVSHMWFFYQRWHGRLAPASHAILLSHGDETNGIVRLSPTVVLLNDVPSLKTLFGKQDAATGTKIVRALNLGGHSWSIMVPEFDLARGRRQAVQAATTETNMRLWRGALEREVEVLLGALRSGGAVDVVRPLRMLTTKASALALAGTEISDATAHEVLEANGLFNRCVANRLCMPDTILSMLDMLPWREHLLSHTSLFPHPRVGSKALHLGGEAERPRRCKRQQSASAVVRVVPSAQADAHRRRRRGHGPAERRHGGRPARRLRDHGRDAGLDPVRAQPPPGAGGTATERADRGGRYNSGTRLARRRHQGGAAVPRARGADQQPHRGRGRGNGPRRPVLSAGWHRRRHAQPLAQPEGFARQPSRVGSHAVGGRRCWRRWCC